MNKLSTTVFSTVMVICSLAGCVSNNSNNSTRAEPIDKGQISESVIQGNSAFAFDIFKDLNREDAEKNIFISPISISTALTMTYQGARGDTQAAMAEALNYKDIDIKQLNDSYKNLLPYLTQIDDKITLDISNSIWIREGEDVVDDFLKVNQEAFDAYIAELDFRKAEAANMINQWIEKSTNGKINKMIAPPVPGDVLMYLMNAIYFKGEWSEKFDKKRTFDTKFHGVNGALQDIQMMNRVDDIELGMGDDFKVIRLPYGNGKTSMYCVLPNEEVSINDFIASMDMETWIQIRESLSRKEDVIIQIPRFKMEYGIKSLNKSLSNLGMEIGFSESADFSGIREQEDIFISQVLHKAVIEVNEEGSEAAAVTVVEMTTAAAVEDPLSFIADRPFLFIIGDDEMGNILFMGKVYSIE